MLTTDKTCSATDPVATWRSDRVQDLHFVRLCENSIGTLRLSSGRTDTYSDSNEVIPFVVSAVEP